MYALACRYVLDRFRASFAQPAAWIMPGIIDVVVQNVACITLILTV